MIRIAMTAALAVSVLPASAFAAEPAKPAAAAPAAPAAAKPAFSTSETDIGTLIDNPTTKAIVEKYIPGMTSNPQIDMARAMTLKAIQSYAPDDVTDERLAKIDADLAKLK